MSREGNLEYIDALRGLAILGVLVWLLLKKFKVSDYVSKKAGVIGLLIIFLDVVRPRLIWLEWLGKISFSLYLVHFFIGAATARWGSVWGGIAKVSNAEISFGVYFLFNVLLSGLVAFFIYKYIELPGMSYILREGKI